MASSQSFDEPSTKVVHYYEEEGPEKRRGCETLLFLFRVITLCFSLASVLLLVTGNHSGNDTGRNTQRWYDFEAYRYVLAMNAIVSTYSLVESSLGLWTLIKRKTVMPYRMAVWFDFSHDQVFAYLLFSSSTGGAVLARSMKTSDNNCSREASSFCTRAEIAVATSFVSFLFIALSSLLSGYRLAAWLITNRQ